MAPRSAAPIRLTDFESGDVLGAHSREPVIARRFGVIAGTRSVLPPVCC